MRVGYDVVALGGDLSTTLAATLLAKRGQHVLLAPGQRKSQAFRSGPHLLELTPRWLSGLTRPLVRRVLAELELDQFVEQRVTSFTPPLQLLLPRMRIDVGSQDDLLLEELEREVGLSMAQGERLLFQLAMASRCVDPVLDPESAGASEPHDDLELRLPPLSTPVGLMLRGPVHSVSPLDPGELGPIPAARLFSSWRQGSGLLIGGLASLELALHEQILAAGGEILPGADPLGLLTSPDGTPRGVMLEGRPGTLLAQRFVLGLSPHKLCAAAMLGPRPELLCRDVAHRHVLHLRFRRGWLPGSLGQLLLFGSGDDAPPVLGIVADPTLTSDEVVLTLQGTLPLNGKARLVAAEQHMVQLVRQVVPFFADAIVDICSPHRDHHAPLASVTAVVNPRSRVPGLPGLPLDLGAGNTALVHPLVLGPLGTEGCFAAALGAANLLS